MATLKAIVRYMREDGFGQVYIRIIHRRQLGHINTGKVVSSRQLSKNMEIVDPYIWKYCSDTIIHYQEMLNAKNISNWDIDQVIRYLLTESDDICFCDYAREHIRRMVNRGQERNARNYSMALANLELFLGTNKVMFADLTSTIVNKWIRSLESTKRAKEMYPVCIRQIYRAALNDFNDYDTGVLRIKSNPWVKVSIPQADRAEKKAISPEACRRFFSAPLPETQMINSTPELGRDVAKLVLCLAGINTVDLYNLKKEDYHDGKICYKRAKTKRSRRDSAYIEMRIEPIIQNIVSKYLSDKDDPYLFSFHSRYATSESFGSGVNAGIKAICKSMRMAQDEWYCVYTFRHTWGTVAQNDCRATISEVAFAMNHSNGHAVTRGYLKLDFSPAWELNAKVIDFIFFSNGVSKQSEKEGMEKKAVPFRVSPRRLITAQAFYQGKELVTITDTGFKNLSEVVDKLKSMLPDTIPDRAIISFRVRNIDSGTETVIEKMN